MKFECIANALDLRAEPRGTVLAELRFGDVFEVAVAKANAEWVYGAVLSGVSIGKKGYVRRKWLIQQFDEPPSIAQLNRTQAARIVVERPLEFEGYYDLGTKAKTWNRLKKRGYIDSTGWVYFWGKRSLKLTSSYSCARTPTSRSPTVVAGPRQSSPDATCAKSYSCSARYRFRRIFMGSWPSTGRSIISSPPIKTGVVRSYRRVPAAVPVSTKFPCGSGCPARLL